MGLKKSKILILFVLFIAFTFSINFVSAEYTALAKGSGFHTPLYSDIIRNPYVGGDTLSIWADVFMIDAGGGTGQPWAMQSDNRLLSFKNGGFTVAVLDGANGRVGIGTSSPSERLYVSGNSIITGTALVNKSFTGGSTGYFEKEITVGSGASSPSTIYQGLKVAGGSPTTDYLVVDDTGIDVTGSAKLTEALKVGASNEDEVGMIRYQDDKFWGRDKDGWNPLVQTQDGGGGNSTSQYIWLQNANGIHYNSGNVGIGTTLPSVELDVVGTGNISSNLEVGGEIFVGDNARITNAIKIGDSNSDEKGMIRYDSTSKQFEGHDEDGWKPLVTTSVGGSSQIWLQNGNEIYYDKGNVNVSDDFLVGNNLNVFGKLDVDGSGNFTGGLTASSINLQNVGSTRVLSIRSNGSQYIEATNDLSIVSPYNIHLGTGGPFSGGIALRVDGATGYVGIGTGDTLATHQLDVDGNADISGDLGVNHLNTSNGLDVSGDSVFDGNVVIKGTLTVEI